MNGNGAILAKVFGESREGLFSRAVLIEMLKDASEYIPNPWEPSDYCYNITNRGIDYEKQPHFFEWVSRGKYMIRGLEYKYDGKVINNKSKECIGVCERGKFRSLSKQGESKTKMEGYTMNKKSLSIFTIERRNDFSSAFSTFFEDLNTSVNTSVGTLMMFAYLDRCIRFWPYRCGAISIDCYLKAMGVDISSPKCDKDLLLIFELLINLLHWAPNQDYKDDKRNGYSLSFEERAIGKESNRMLENAEYILENCCNMWIREGFDEDEDEFPRYYITKRDQNVDVAVVAVPELSEILLGYLDIRNEEDLEYKKKALSSIYGYMEPHRNEYKSLACKSLSEEFFCSMNSFGIRHNTKSQIRLNGKKKRQICDKLFMISVYVLQTVMVNDYKRELKELREK